MSDLFGSRIAGGNTAYHRVKSDFYPTPPDATKAILRFLQLPKSLTIWEPACGEGHMVETIRGAGYECIGTDIESGTDYLTAKTPQDADFIITNPPFSLATEFIETSIQRELPFAFLLKCQFFNAKSRLNLFDFYPPTWICPLTWRPDFLFKTRGKGSPLMDVSWYVWIPGDHRATFQPLARPT